MSRRVLRERTVLISGAAGGLGSALCAQFAKAGARIAALDRDGLAAANEVFQATLAGKQNPDRGIVIRP